MTISIFGYINVHTAWVLSNYTCHKFVSGVVLLFLVAVAALLSAEINKLYRILIIACQFI